MSTSTSMHTTTSADGTVLAYDRLGSGPPVVLLAGAFNTRAATAPLAEALQERFTVLNLDRRGRGDSGDSGDTASYAVEREVEDIDALVTQAGGSAAVFGYSSGANLALRAAAQGVPISKLALYEPPFVVDEDHPRPPRDLARQLAELVAAGRRGDAVELYQTAAIGMPEPVVAQLRQAPFRPALEAIAHTLVYDATIIGDLTLPAELASITTPTLVIDGDQSAPVMRAAARAVADTLPNARRHTLPGQGHDIDPTSTAAALATFL
jgi:pimeloyl-ACP methyl ester carboxylesterase